MTRYLLAEGRDAMSELLGVRAVQKAFPGNHTDCDCKLCAAKSWLATVETALVERPKPTEGVISRIRRHRALYKSSLYDAKNAVDAGWTEPDAKPKLTEKEAVSIMVAAAEKDKPFNRFERAVFKQMMHAVFEALREAGMQFGPASAGGG